ncbi:MAG: alpha/beta hydrolase family protein, partial [Casimicrobium sp.]
MMNKTVVSLLFAVGATMVTPAIDAKAPAEQAARFDYAKAAAKAASGGTFAKAKCCNITEWVLTTPEGETVELTVVDPVAKGKHPMVLWLHREGQEVKRAGFQQEAEALAAQGIASLLVELPFKRPFVHRSDNNAGDADAIRLAIVNARRTLDWAATRPEYDMKKVAV